MTLGHYPEPDGVFLAACSAISKYLSFYFIAVEHLGDTRVVLSEVGGLRSVYSRIIRLNNFSLIFRDPV